ncbi:putative nucleic acid-binding protein [Mesorhizobium sangaii]|uniref:Putative nucleic acid-binding protein n=2 Tax=Mesorhizobium sangaii TaxID=505389 RepID=A0A841NX98_9HYPH|nr:putative nucleic acid-binding protein [Mesorhizobium sangaii]
MKKIHDVRAGCKFSKRKVFFDTNVWIAIDGNDPRPTSACYSDFYGEICKSDNVIVINDYVIGEFFNRTCKTNYKLMFDDDPEMRQFKSRRSANRDFRLMVESVRDTCLNFLDDCEYEPAAVDRGSYQSIVEEAGKGEMDLTDIVVREHCLAKGYVLVSHDADFINCGIELVTANRKLLPK